MFFSIVLCSDIMKIAYELNPPKIVKGEKFDLVQLKGNIQQMIDRASQLYGLVKAFHLTDSVLGIPRVSSITAARMLKKEGYDLNIKLDLSFPAKVKDKSAQSIRNKLDVIPHSLVTQSISSLSDLGEITDLAKPYGIKVTAVVMVPSEKNRQSASLIGLDWSEYESNPVDFIRQAAKMADRVLLTSPNSFASGLQLLRQLK